MRLKEIGFVFLGFLLSVSTAHANISGCFERSYTKAELARHPKMQITDMYVRLGVSDGSAETQDQIGGKLRHTHQRSKAKLTCNTKLFRVNCEIERNGGDISITETMDGVLVENLGAMFIGPDENGDNLVLGMEDDQKEFHLKEVKLSNCNL
jgi:hypothetical protein